MEFNQSNMDQKIKFKIEEDFSTKKKRTNNMIITENDMSKDNDNQQEYGEIYTREALYST